MFRIRIEETVKVLNPEHRTWETLNADGDRGWTPPIEKQEERTIVRLEQNLEQLDLAGVIRAVNRMDQ